MLENSPICPNMIDDLLISPLIRPHYFPFFFAMRSAIVERGVHGLSHCCGTMNRMSCGSVVASGGAVPGGNGFLVLEEEG